MIKRLKYVLGVAALLLAAAGCETDLDINGNPKPTAVIYGLIDFSEGIQVIKITRTFLGDGNALDYAQAKDSSEINFSSAPVLERYNGTTLETTVALRDTIISGKPSGTFYSGNAKYYVIEGGSNFFFPNKTHFYRLKFAYNGQEVHADTRLAGRSSQDSPQALVLQRELVANNVRTSPIRYSSITFKSTPAPNVKSIRVKVFFEYDEILLNGDSTRKSIELSNTQLTVAKLDEPTQPQLQTAFNVAQMMENISVSKNDAAVSFRAVKNIVIQMTNEAQELFTYNQVNGGTSGTIQERPEFSNVVNGLGLFSSYSVTNNSMPLGDLTSRALAINEKYLGMKFCSRRPTLLTEGDVTCPQ
ncbi:MAG: hypothetical protein V4616_05340 [Bacteroidota bacterium]